METTGKNNSEYRPQQSFSASAACSRAVPSSSISSNRCQYPVREARNDNGKNGDRNRGRSLMKNLEKFNEEQGRNQFREEQHSTLQTQQLTPGFLAYAYNTPEHYIDRNQRVVTGMPAFNYMNHPWGVGALDQMSVSQNNLSVIPAATGMSIMPGMDMTQNSGTGLSTYGFMGVPPESSMLPVMGVGGYSYGIINGQENSALSYPKKLIRLSKCVLIPTNRPVKFKEKPLICKTIYVGSLLDKITKDIIAEIFGQCGTILSINMNNRNGNYFCHIRFETEEQVQAALYYNGYKIKLDEETCSKPIQVDYAKSTEEDEREYQLQIRLMNREARHREREEQELSRVPTPPLTAHYSENEVALLMEKLKNEETFQEAILTLITWLDKGECTKSNFGRFFCMIQSVHNYIKRLIIAKQNNQVEFNKAKSVLKQQMLEIFRQFHEIEKLYVAASAQKVWSQFSKFHRKQINPWKTQIEQFKSIHIQEMIEDCEEDGAEVGDVNCPEKSQNESYNEAEECIKEKINDFRKKNKEMSCQLEAVTNEVAVFTSENSAYKSRIKELELEKKLREERVSKFKQRNRVTLDNDVKDSQNISDTEGMPDSPGSSEITENEVHIVGLISTFLNVHPFGASIDYICSYLHQIDNTFEARDVENLLKRFPSLFKEESSGIGASLEKKWFYFGFKSSF